MGVLLADMSVAADLARGDLLEQLAALPHAIVVSDLLLSREREGGMGNRLSALGLAVESLSGKEMVVAARLLRSDRALSSPDAFAITIARSRAWPLLTGDGPLRRTAEAAALDIRDTFWVLDEIERHGLLRPRALHMALTAMTAHPRCRLSRSEAGRRLTFYRR